MLQETRPYFQHRTQNERTRETASGFFCWKARVLVNGETSSPGLATSLETTKHTSKPILQDTLGGAGVGEAGVRGAGEDGEILAGCMKGPSKAYRPYYAQQKADKAGETT